jgi:hypothetical protein
MSRIVLGPQRSSAYARRPEVALQWRGGEVSHSRRPLRQIGMHANSSAPDPIDLAAEAGALGTALSTLTIQLFPFALPLLILVIGPLVLLGLVGLVIALPIILPLWLGRRAFRALRRGPQAPPVAHHHRGRLAQ